MRIILGVIITLLCLTQCKQKDQILVFSKTKGFRHTSIQAGHEAIRQIGLSNNWSVKVTEEASVFHSDSLKYYNAVIFLSTTGDILNEAQQIAFKNFINNGGGFVGLHAATNTEEDWPWYNGLVGAYFADHPKVQEASLVINDRSHISTQHLADKWIRTDEWYNFKCMHSDLITLILVDEKSYSGGKHGEYHPVTWYKVYDGGRSWYTAMGHTTESFSDPDFLQHIEGGIKYVLGYN